MRLSDAQVRNLRACEHHARPILAGQGRTYNVLRRLGLVSIDERDRPRYALITGKGLAELRRLGHTEPRPSRRMRLVR